MNDDEMDDLMVEAARDYNSPGAVPRDEMWTRIQAARAERPRAGGAPVSGRSRWLWPGVGIAAAAVLAVGISLGRTIERGARASAATRVDVAAKPPVAPRPDSAGGGATASPATLAATDTLVRRIHDQTAVTNRRARELAASAIDSGARSGDGVPENESTRLAYRLVMLQHIAGSEAMITAFRASARRGDVDAQTARWARELLGTTRLLESSPAADDPTMRRLLQDLDLVIAQIVQYASHGTTNPEELDLIERSIQRRGIMTKLRGTTPARAFGAGT